MRSRAIQNLWQEQKINITQACKLLGYSSKAYYKSLLRQERQDFETDILIDLIRAKRRLWKKGSGRNLLNSLQNDLMKHNIKIGRDKFFEFLKVHDLQIKRRKIKPYTTNSLHHYRKHPNLIKELTVKRINHLWVSDMTYIYVRSIEKWSYLFLITDVYNREVIGYCLSQKPDGAAAVRALRKRGITKVS